MSMYFNNSTHVYIQLMEQIKYKIVSGVYPLGLKIPSVRTIAHVAHVSPNTVQKSLIKLEIIGLICSKGTKGRFVTEDNQFIKYIQSDLAMKQINMFFSDMISIGVTREQAISMIKAYL